MALCDLQDYRRYGRQLILEGFGLPAQLKLQESSVVVVGAGGLGCPALQYLAAAGIGRLGIVDHDTVELSNLQRQILHSESRLGKSKAHSAAESIKEINCRTRVDVMDVAMEPSNARSLLEPYDLILDCTDNAPTRYLLSDSAVALRKPLVSGAATRYDGQLCIYNYGPDGPCYRCLFPKPSAAENAPSCEEAGILGTVTGIIGNLQALEAIKIIAGLHDGKPSLLIFSALSSPQFRTIKLRSRKRDCLACSDRTDKPQVDETDYVAFCGGPTPNWSQTGLSNAASAKRIRPRDLSRILRSESDDTLLIDVRSTTEFGICHLPSSRNIPLRELVANPLEASRDLREDLNVIIVCRSGNDSQIAADALRSVHASGPTVRDLVGGLRLWSEEVDPSFPVY